MIHTLSPLLQAGRLDQESYGPGNTEPPRPPIFPDRTVTSDAAAYLWNSQFFPAGKTESFTCKCQTPNHWRLDNYFKFLMFSKFQRAEKKRGDRTYVSREDRNREAEIKWLLSTLSLSWMFWIPGTRWMCNWHIPLYEPRIIGIWLVAFVIQYVNYSWEKHYRPLWDCVTSLTANL